MILETAVVSKVHESEEREFGSGYFRYTEKVLSVLRLFSLRSRCSVVSYSATLVVPSVSSNRRPVLCSLEQRYQTLIGGNNV